jgi:hypothetical protein
VIGEGTEKRLDGLGQYGAPGAVVTLEFGEPLTYLTITS